VPPLLEEAQEGLAKLVGVHVWDYIGVVLEETGARERLTDIRGECDTTRRWEERRSIYENAWGIERENPAAFATLTTLEMGA
jgi:hypothetical protein